MYNCPECNNPTVWQSDFQEEEEVCYSLWSCSDCHIDITKAYYVMYDVDLEEEE